MNQETPSTSDIQTCLKVLEAFNQSPAALLNMTIEERVALIKAAGQFSRPHREEIRKRHKELKKEHRVRDLLNERRARAATGIRSAREATVFQAPLQITDQNFRGKLNSARNCYVCKDEYVDLHHFYDQMCPKCAEFNYQKRFQTADLTGQVALITGSRLKIGYHCTLMLLRAGATVIATTRFPVDSAKRFAQEADFNKWRDRLHIYGLDLRHSPSVEWFASYVERNYARLDILINNAAQTVRRPAGFYAHLMPLENMPYTQLSEDVQHILKSHENCKSELLNFANPGDQNLPVSWHAKAPGIGIRSSAKLSQIPYSFDNSLVAEEVFPEGKLDSDLQQVDLRKTNSWRLKLGEVPTVEMLEVQLVNAVAPFILCNRLANLMKRDFTGCKHMINVSAMEGKFQRFKKEDRHPHTNMAKAALNMMTHTAASDLAQYGIYINAVDTGWVTDEDPAELAKRKQDLHDFQPPLDIVDGAARVMDPLFDGILTGKHWSGKFLKDYFPIDW